MLLEEKCFRLLPNLLDGLNEQEILSRHHFGSESIDHEYITNLLKPKLEAGTWDLFVKFSLAIATSQSSYTLWGGLSAPELATLLNNCLQISHLSALERHYASQASVETLLKIEKETFFVCHVNHNSCS